jgi:hypothetical protein
LSTVEDAERDDFFIGCIDRNRLEHPTSRTREFQAILAIIR